MTPTTAHRHTAAAATRLMAAMTVMLAMLAPAATVRAQALGTWQVYPSYTTATKNIPVGSRVYALMEHKLMVYDTDDESITTFDCLRQLNDVNISLMDYSPEAKRIILVYDNSNIDLLSTEDDGDIVNLAQLKNSTRQTVAVTALSVADGKAYLTTNVGIVVVDMANGVILSTYDIQQTIRSAATDGTNLYAVTTTGVWRGHLADNLQDPANWECINTAIKGAYNMTTFGGRVVCSTGSYICWSSPSGNSFSVKQMFQPTVLSVSGGQLIIGNGSQMDIYTSPTESKHYTGTFACTDLRHATGSTYWASDGLDGLQAYTLQDDGTFSLQRSRIQYNSPDHDYAHHVAYAGDRLLATGGSVNYGYATYPGTAMMLEPDGTWRNFSYRSATAFDPEDRYINVTDIAQDPLDPDHHYVATARDGIYEFRDTVCVGHITLGNSPLGSILPDNANPKWFVVASGTRYDPDGNLWVLNSAQDTIIRIMRPNGTWASLYYPEIAGTTAIDHLLFDSRGWAWMTSRRLDGRGLFCLRYNGTIDNVGDDKHFLRTQIVNQDNTSYAPNEFYGMAEDHDGRIWFGTEMGLFVVSDPEGYMDSDFTFEQVKVARNDGSGLADYLLANIPVLSIAIDGADRKWVGTTDNGVYLISADSQEQLLHFTTDNSPLLDNNVSGIAINPRNGMVVFATAKGLCSYMSDATDGIDSPDDDDLLVYPNPVRPDYNGPIAIRGLAAGSDVKIVTSSGQVVWSGTSNGGMFTWNGLTQTGRRPASGIYLVIATQPNGKQAVAAKIAFIK